ncbi:MAG: threonine synthase [Candidatus Aenigmarchaeota archaeon]|nr:threonine synthase [Candidatus Aenigmarchaeota archaeon]NIP40701.1 threonine synthase [Candidatus Aenigmarchaeota archaeon]NIQ18507.1 threonine synthase [Candidatus Aenigmarchaeota archaeon]NIS73406.1 threonine synthase [Candidatus Aenigmarchaeota archaeon]
MFEDHIFCETCGRKYPAGRKIFRCGRCGGSLEVIFDYGKMRRKVNLKLLRSRRFDHLRYLEFYPVKKPVSIQEGGTPLVRSSNIEHSLGLGFQLWFKNEGLNPSGSFKDRGSSIEIAKAKEFRARKVVCASTGNMGASVSAYSGLANLECYIFTPEDAVPVKLEQILGYGARLYKISGSYSQAEKLVREANRKYGVHLLGDYLYRREGTKSVGFEILDQLDFRTKDLWIVSPVGNGTLISAVWKAVKEFETLGFIKDRPKLIGVQAEGCNPVVKAFRSGVNVKPFKRARTVAVAIECGDPLDGRRVLESIRESGGFMESVSDGEILKAREMLARKEGLFAEPAGAVSLAGLLKAGKRIKKRSKVVSLVTGHGLKTPKTDIPGREIRISKDPGVLKGIFG